MPIIDIVVAVILMVTTGYFWYHTKGVAKLQSAYDAYWEATETNQTDLARTQALLAEAEQELEDTRNLRDAKAEYAAFLEGRIEAEIQAIEDSRHLDEDYTDEVLDLRTQIQRSRDKRLAYKTDILETERKIAEATAVNDDLEAQALERNHEMARLDLWIADAQSVLEADPPSRFPKRSALAAVADISDPAQTMMLSLSYGLTSMGNLDVGVLGSLGLATDGSTSLKEGAVFANLPIVPRKASIDFEGGISQFESREEDRSSTTPYAGASLRFAPSAKERLFLLAGTRYSHEDLALRLGLALGRR